MNVRYGPSGCCLMLLHYFVTFSLPLISFLLIKKEHFSIFIPIKILIELALLIEKYNKKKEFSTFLLYYPFVMSPCLVPSCV